MKISSSDTACPSCTGLRAEVDALKHLVLEMRQQMDALQHKLSQTQTEWAQTQTALEKRQAELARARKNSSNSSKPPSSDIVKAKKPSSSGRRKKRKIGGQPGHSKHERLFSLSDADQQHTYELDTCPHCASRQLEVWPGAEKTTYQHELVDQPIQLHVHQRPAYWCPDCHKIHHASLPVEVRKGGLVGPELTALIGYLKGNGHLSYATIQSLLDDGLRCSLSGGMLVKVVQKVSQALAKPYEEMVQTLPQQKTLNIDETSHPENGKLLWNWVFRTPDFTCFTIEESRGAQVLEDRLGIECEATLGSDYYSSYRAFMKKAPVTVQFCLAHLIREARFIAQSSTKVIANYGQRVLDGLKAPFSSSFTSAKKYRPIRFGDDFNDNGIHSCARCGAPKPEAKPPSWPNAFAPTGRNTLPLSPSPISIRPTTSPNEPSDSVSLIDSSPGAPEAYEDGNGVSGSGPSAQPVPRKGNAFSILSARRFKHSLPAQRHPL